MPRIINSPHTETEMGIVVAHFQISSDSLEEIKTYL
jgi:hypothetical protein